MDCKGDDNMTLIMAGMILMFIIGSFAIKMHIDEKHEFKCNCKCWHCKDEEK